MIRKQLRDKIDDIEVRLNLKQLELNALLEVTQAINANISADSLFKIYHFTLLGNLNISKLALFVFDEQWECKVQYGVPEKLEASFLSPEMLLTSEISETANFCGCSSFDVLIPIAHNRKQLAFVLVGGIHQLEMEEVGSILSFVQTITSIIIVAIENKKLARRQLQQEVLRKELEIAGKVQNNLFPRTLPDTDRVKIKACYFPHRLVGGDYYDYLELEPGKFIVCIADVSGKGIPAALLMSSVQAGLKTLVRRSTDLKDIINELNYLVKSNAQGERFITFFLALVDLNKGQLSYVNAGHNPPFLLSGGNLHTLSVGTTILGAFDMLPFIEESIIPFSGKALLFAYTDGFTETENEEDEAFGEERLEACLKEFSLEKGNTEDLHKTLLTNVSTFKGTRSFPDDVTFLSCLFG